MAAPKTPPWLTETNSVVKLIENPCNAPWIVYAQTALPIVGAAVIRLFDFGYGDVIRGAARPRAARSEKKTGIRRRGGRGGGIPEVGNIVGKTLGGGEQLEGRQITNGVRNMWILDGAIQRGLWTWLIADIVADSFYNWTTAIMTSTCDPNVPEVGSAAAESIDNATFFTPGNAWLSIPSGLILYEDGQATAQNGSCWNGGAPFQAQAAIQADQGLLPGGRIEIGIFDGSDFVPIAGGTSGETQNVVADVDGFGPIQLFAYRTNGGSFVGKAYTTTFG